MSKKNTLVSILMPVYNCIDTLEKALDCAIKQTYKNTEILISDNASKENLDKIYKKKKYKKIKVIKQKFNIGGIRNYNYLISKSKGKYFMFLHSDDTISKNYIEECMNEMILDKKVSIAVGKIYQSSQCFIDTNKLNLQDRRKRLVNFFTYQYPDAYINGLINKKFVKKFNLNFMSCEIPFLIELISNGKLVYTDKCFYDKTSPLEGRLIKDRYDWYFLNKTFFSRYGYFFDSIKIIFMKLKMLDALKVALIFSLYNLPLIKKLFTRSKPHNL